MEYQWKICGEFNVIVTSENSGTAVSSASGTAKRAMKSHGLNIEQKLGPGKASYTTHNFETS